MSSFFFCVECTYHNTFLSLFNMDGLDIDKNHNVAVQNGGTTNDHIYLNLFLMYDIFEIGILLINY